MRFFEFALTVMLVVGAWFTFLVSARNVSAALFGDVTSSLIWAFAAVVPAFVFYGEDGRYTAVAEAPIEFTRTSDPQADLERNSQLLASRFESVIREHPDQWFNYKPLWPAAT